MAYSGKAGHLATLSANTQHSGECHMVRAATLFVGMLTLVLLGTIAPPLFALDVSSLRQSSNVVDLRPSQFGWTLHVYDGNGDKTSVPLLCDVDNLSCEFDTRGAVAPSPTVTATATAVFLPTVEKSTATPTATESPTSPPTTPTTGSGLTRINYATVDELEALPHVGPTIRARIVDARPLLSCEDADARVKGWGAKMNADTCPLIDWTP